MTVWLQSLATGLGGCRVHLAFSVFFWLFLLFAVVIIHYSAFVAYNPLHTHDRDSCHVLTLIGCAASLDLETRSSKLHVKPDSDPVRVSPTQRNNWRRPGWAQAPTSYQLPVPVLVQPAQLPGPQAGQICSSTRSRTRTCTNIRAACAGSSSGNWTAAATFKNPVPSPTRPRKFLVEAGAAGLRTIMVATHCMMTIAPARAGHITLRTL